MKGLVFILLGYVLCQQLPAQDSASHPPRLRSRFFLDAYFSHDLTDPGSHEKPPFLFNHHKNNKPQVNLALAGVSYSRERFRVNAGLMAGTYANANLAEETSLFRHVYEANAGVKITSGLNLWVDMGILPSHIGFESAISSESWTLSRSMVAENSPYYEAGARISYLSTDEKWLAAALILNGWQRIRRIPGISTPALGTQLTHQPNASLRINWSAFFGNEQPDTAGKWRVYHNLYAQWQVQERWGFIAGFDYGMEQIATGSGRYSSWRSPVLVIRYRRNAWSVAARLEAYHDRAGVIMPRVSDRPFQMRGYSLNVDRKLGKHMVARVEWRILSSRTPYFTQVSRLRGTAQHLTASVAFDFRHDPLYRHGSL